MSVVPTFINVWKDDYDYVLLWLHITLSPDGIALTTYMETIEGNLQNYTDIKACAKLNSSTGHIQ